MAVGQNQWYHFGVGEFTTRVRTYFSGDWDVHWGGFLPMAMCFSFRNLRAPGQGWQVQRSELGPGSMRRGSERSSSERLDSINPLWDDARNRGESFRRNFDVPNLDRWGCVKTSLNPGSFTRKLSLSNCTVNIRASARSAPQPCTHA